MPPGEALRWLYARQGLGVHLGLSRMERLLARLGDPQEGLEALHVGGTNGKGSTSAFLEAALRREGYRTGLYLSPHVTDFGERIQVRGEALAGPEVARCIEAVRPAVEELDGQGDPPTFFETLTAAAFEHFRAAGVEVAVVEVGLGGRLDATNVLEPLLSVVTNVGLDHTDRLGTTIEAIAGEKAGILKPGTPAVTGCQGRALNVLSEKASATGAPLRGVSPGELRIRQADLDGTAFEADAWGRRRRFRLRMLGDHQAMNALLAVRGLETMRRFRVLPESAEIAMAEVRVPGRLERFEGGLFIDGAHNPPAISAVATFLSRFSGSRDARVVLGVLRDKDLGAMLEALRPLRPRVLATSVPNLRTRSSDEVAAAARAAGFVAQSFADPGDALGELDRLPGGLRLVTGSLFLAGDVRRRLLGLEPNPLDQPVVQ